MENSLQIQTNNKKESIGYAAFFSHRDEVEIIYEEYIIDLITFRKYPNEIKYKRNIMLYLTGFQIAASILAVLLMIFRRSFVYLIINSISLILAIIGLYGSLKVNLVYLLIHCIFTTSITGGFFTYEILNLIFGSDTAYGNEKRANDKFIIFLFSLPYLYDCFVGIYNYLFLKLIAVFNSENKKKHELLKNEVVAKKEFSEEQINRFISNTDNKLCVICMSESRDTVLNPCGHILCCENCAKSIFENSYSQARCPVCKSKCTKYIKVYIS